MTNLTAPNSVLVAGGAGYIGSHTAKALLAAQINPVVLDNLCTGYRNTVRFGPFYEGSIADSSLVDSLIRQEGVIAAILFAGHAYVGESTGNPRKYFRNNIADALRFLDALVDAGVRLIVFSSSCSVYGTQECARLDEDCPTNPLSPYAETKRFFETVLRWYASAYGIRYVALRYFNAAGADPDGELGEQHEPETHLIPLTIQAAMGGKPLQVFGTDYPTHDGTAIRDYTHVTDLADAHLRALRHLAGGGESLTLNLGTGTGYSVREVIRAVENESGRAVPVEYRPRRVGDAPSLVANAARAKEMLGWTPVYSALDVIVGTAWRWHTRPAMAT